jgi:hypothetical protein
MPTLHWLNHEEALKVGLDFPFAYVFCSVANARSARAVEQILRRVLRMPYAQKRNIVAPVRLSDLC